MKCIRQFLGLVCLMLFSATSLAQSIPLDNLSDDDFKKVVGDMSANFLHTSVSGAGTLGHVFGFEIGLVAGQTKTPHLQDVATKNSPTTKSDAEKLPHAALLGVLTVPLGISAELAMVPKTGSGDFKFSTMGLAAKWTITELFFTDLPFSLATKLSVTKTNLDFKQTISSIPIDYSYKNSETALMGIISKNLALVEPYFGVGTVSASGDLSASTTVFASGSQSANAKRSSMMWMLGTELKLVFFKIGVEYTNLFNTGRFTGKLAFYF